MKRFKLKKLNNEGAALILAMVIVLFITVLTSLLLYVSGVNFEMKTTDYRNRVSFYGAEEPLEELRVLLAEDVSKASAAAYKEVFLRFTELNSKEVREDEFQKLFFENIEKIWNNRGVTDFMNSEQWEAAIQSVMDSTKYDVYESDESQIAAIPYHIEVIVPEPMNGVLGTTLERDEPNERILLCRLRVHYTEDDFLSIIYTDFAMDVPKIDWGVDFYENPTGGVPSGEKSSPEAINFEECVKYLDWEKQ